ncbi:MAG: preprotein translocase subunit YajC [Novosphingobium sp.]|nr:preprotein translocase subunit YajC [Novosphingobium sp.]
MTSPSRATISALCALAAMALPAAAQAQSIPYGSVSGGGSSGPGDGGNSGSGSGKGSSASRGARTSVTPYIEASQIATAELSPGDEVLTYSTIAAGVEAVIAGNNSAASASLRYERRFGWGKANDEDVISGLARGYMTVAPGVQIDAGALAARTSVDGGGSLATIGDNDYVTQVYSVYAGPSVATRAGDVAITANYRIGYTRAEEPNGYVPAPGEPAVDVFDDSVVQSANVHAGVKPYEVLPVGIGVGAGWYREDISALDQRVEDLHVRADVTVPVTESVALVGGVGYEKVEISSRDAVRDANGDPVVGPNGRYVTDKSIPRLIAYDVDGLLWDAGVVWRPSRRTALEAHVGRRYGATSYYGTFAWSPGGRSALNVSVYDNIAGFGGQINRALVDLPTEFSAVRNPLTGNLGGCVAALEGGTCLNNVLGAVRSATFRARGVMATYGYNFGSMTAGVGAGYDRRKFVAAQGTVLAAYNGLVDENYWMSAYLNGRIDQHSSYSTNVYANWFKSGVSNLRDASVLGATAAYNRNLAENLSATAALGLDGVNREDPLEDFWTASALLGVRYSF